MEVINILETHLFSFLQKVFNIFITEASTETTAD